MLGIAEYADTEVVIGPSCHEPGCRGYGSTKSGVMFIGIAPGKDEVKSGRPLTGPSGRILNNTLKALGLDRKDVYCTNLICWWKDEPTKEEADRCSNRLEREIKEIQPKLIILLGKIVAEIFFGRSFGKLRGAVQWSDKYNCYIMVTYHPAAILRSMGDRTSGKDDRASIMIHDFVRDIKKVPFVLTWKPGAPQAKITYTVVDDPKEAQYILNSFSQDEYIVLDVETTYSKDDEEVDILKDTVLCVGVGNSNHAWVFTPDTLFKEGRPILHWPDVRWIMHNALFDVQIMKRNFDVWIDVKEDTMLQSYTLDERSGVHRLKSLAREYLAVGFYEEDRFYGKMRLDEIDTGLLYEYNAKDVVYTARLHEILKEWQIQDDVRGFYEQLLIPAVNMYKEVQYRGVKIDKKLHMHFAKVWGEKYLKDEQELIDIAQQEGWEGDININSPSQLGTFLFRILGMPIIKYTNKGQPSTDQKVLEALKGQHIFVDKLIDFRHLSHMYSLYILGFIPQLDTDYKAHAVVKLHGSRTGRPSYTKPPLQTIPVPYMYQDDFGQLRRLFIPSSPDNVIIEADYGKAEIWMAYAYSGDEQLYADLTSGDYHTTVAMDILEKKKEEVTGEDRLDMKKVTFGIMYDREAPSLSEALKKPIHVTQSYINRFFSRNKKYAKWFRDTQQAVRQTGELVSKTGRKRRIVILGNMVRALKQAVNFPIQSTTSDVLLASAIELHPKLKEIGGHLLFTVHDSIVSEVPKSRLEEGIKIIHDCMTAKRFEGIPQIPVEIKYGQSWGEVKEIHDCAKEYCLWKES